MDATALIMALTVSASNLVPVFTVLIEQTDNHLSMETFETGLDTEITALHGVCY